MSHLRKRNSKLYRQIIAGFLFMVLFSISILTVTAILYAKDYEESFLLQLNESMSSAGEKLNESTVALMELSSLILQNPLIIDNLRPYKQVTSRELYFYKNILTLLYQSRLQFNSLVDSMFLYADEKRVLYSMKERGVVSPKVFWEDFLSYETYSKDYWLSLLDEAQPAAFTLLPADSYSTSHSRDQHMVIPMVDVHPNYGTRNVLVMNLSIDKIASVYAAARYCQKDMLVIYDHEGRQLFGSEDSPAMDVLSSSQYTMYGGQKCYVSHNQLSSLELTVYAFTPVTAFYEMTGYFRASTYTLITLFTICGLAIALIMSRRTYAPIRDIGYNLQKAQDKPFDADKYLSNELEAIHMGISNLAQDREHYKARSQQQIQHYIVQSFINILDNQSIIDQAYFTGLLHMEYGFSAKAYRCACLVFNSSQSDSFLLYKESMEKLCEALSEIFNPTPVVTAPYYPSMLVTLIDASEQNEETIRRLLMQAVQRLTDLDQLTTRLGLGGAVDNINELPESFDQALTEIFRIPSDDTLPVRIEGEFVYDRSEIISAANTRDLKRVSDAAEEVLAQAKACGLRYSKASAIARDIYKTVMDVQRRLSPNQIYAPIYPGKEEFSTLDVLILSPEINLSPMLSALIKYIPYQNNNNLSKSSFEIVERLKDFIDHNYMQELSLDIIADNLNMSSKYLSHIFKQSTGNNLSDYLAYVRVQTIKELLLEDINLEIIAQSVGISNRTTFIRTFKKLEGITPSEWRSVHRSQLPET